MNLGRFRVRPGHKVKLRRYDPADTRPFKNEEKAGDLLTRGIERLVALQERLYAQDRWAVLLIFQAMDAAGKDSAIKHVMSGLNPQGTQVFSFKRPSDEELDHDYLWRTVKALPERGRIGIFNRSYYEEVLVVRVHPHLLDNEQLPWARTRSRFKTGSRQRCCGERRLLGRVVVPHGLERCGVGRGSDGGEGRIDRRLHRAFGDFGGVGHGNPV